jgi:DNA-binding response OmpR family regulator
MVALRRGATHRSRTATGTADGRLVIDPDRLTAGVDGHREPLTPTEWQLLSALVAAPGTVLSRQELAARAWGPGYRSRGSEVEVYISRLRRKLGDGRRNRMIETVRGRGYRFVDGQATDPP